MPREYLAHLPQDLRQLVSRTDKDVRQLYATTKGIARHERSLSEVSSESWSRSSSLNGEAEELARAYRSTSGTGPQHSKHNHHQVVVARGVPRSSTAPGHRAAKDAATPMDRHKSRGGGPNTTSTRSGARLRDVPSSKHGALPTDGHVSADTTASSSLLANCPSNQCSLVLHRRNRRGGEPSTAPAATTHGSNGRRNAYYEHAVEVSSSESPSGSLLLSTRQRNPWSHPHRHADITPATISALSDTSQSATTLLTTSHVVAEPVSSAHVNAEERDMERESSPSSPDAPQPSLPTRAASQMPHDDEPISAEKLLLERLRHEVEEKNRAMLELRLSHSKEVAALRDAIHAARSEAAKEMSQQLASTYAIKQSRLQAALEAESTRAAEAEERCRIARQSIKAQERALDERAAELAHITATHTNAAAELERAQSSVAELSAEVALLRGKCGRYEEEAAQAVAHAHEAEHHAHHLQQQVEELERRLLLQAEDAKATLKELEAEFGHTTESFTALLQEETGKCAQLERVQRRYKAQKENVARLNREKAELEEHVQRAREEMSESRRAHELVVEQLHADVTKLMEQHKQEAVAHAALTQDYQQRLSTQSAGAETEAKTLREQLDITKHSMEVLQGQVDSLRRELMEEQAASRKNVSAAAASEMRLKQELAEQQRSAAAHKVSSEDAISSLKRQLREKTAQLQALAASSVEPVQRLRQQLEEERGRRAHLEEQFARFKKDAKTAEEQSRRELRREQLRSGALLDTPTLGTISPPTRSTSVSLSPSLRVRPSPGTASQPSPAAHLRRSVSLSPPKVHTTNLGVGSTTPPAQLLKNRRQVGPTVVMRTEGGTSPSSKPSSAKHRNRSPVHDDVAAGGKSAESTPSRRQANNNNNKNITPVGTVGSLSIISKTSLDCSPNREEEMEENARLLNGLGGGAVVAEVRARVAEVELHRPEVAVRMLPEEDLQPHVGQLEERLAKALTSTDEQEDADHLLTSSNAHAHERRMNEFKMNAGDVFRRITGSREAFIAQCAAIVRRTRYPSSSRRAAGARDEGANHPATPHDESSEEYED